jgi:hypothetical protein
MTEHVIELSIRWRPPSVSPRCPVTPVERMIKSDPRPQVVRHPTRSAVRMGEPAGHADRCALMQERNHLRNQNACIFHGLTDVAGPNSCTGRSRKRAAIAMWTLGRLAMDRAIDEGRYHRRDLSALRSRLPWLVPPITIAHHGYAAPRDFNPAYVADGVKSVT